MRDKLKQFFKKDTIFVHSSGKVDHKEVEEFVRKYRAGEIKTHPLSEYKIKGENK